MPLLLTVSCFSNIHIVFTFLVPAHLGSPGKGPLNGCVCVIGVQIYILTFTTVYKIHGMTLQSATEPV